MYAALRYVADFKAGSSFGKGQAEVTGMINPLTIGLVSSAVKLRQSEKPGMTKAK
jgi:hypothetical protein